MVEDKVIFIIPGYKQYPTDVVYKKIADMLMQEGFYPILVTIPWETGTVLQNTDLFIGEYKKNRARKKYILGFSFGAMIAFAASTKVSVSGLILCSLSPYFKEDLRSVYASRSSSKQLRIRREFLKLSCRDLAKRIRVKQLLMIYGADEDTVLIKRVQETYKMIASKNKQLLSVAGSEHDMGDRRYFSAIRRTIRVLQ